MYRYAASLDLLIDQIKRSFFKPSCIQLVMILIMVYDDFDLRIAFCILKKKKIIMTVKI